MTASSHGAVPYLILKKDTEMTRLEMNLQLRRVLNYEAQKSFNRLLYLGGIDDFGDEIEFEITDPDQLQDTLALFEPLNKYFTCTVRIYNA